MARVRWRGKTFDRRTAQMLQEAEKIARVRFRPVQGSYSRGSLSAGTHSGGGAVDLDVSGYSRANREKVVKALRTVGFAAWLRTRNEGPWGDHIHGIAIGQPDSAPIAKRQVISYKNGRNGLRSNRKDRHAYMKVPFRTWEQYKRATAKPKPKPKPLLPKYPGSKFFKAGAKSQAVKVIQAAFKHPITGTMTAKDVASVKAFQKKRPWLWPADGIVGPKTYANLAKSKLVTARWR